MNGPCVVVLPIFHLHPNSPQGRTSQIFRDERPYSGEKKFTQQWTYHMDSHVRQLEIEMTMNETIAPRIMSNLRKLRSFAVRPLMKVAGLLINNSSLSMLGALHIAWTMAHRHTQ